MAKQLRDMSRRGFLAIGAFAALLSSPFRRLLAGDEPAGAASGEPVWEAVGPYSDEVIEEPDESQYYRGEGKRSLVAGSPKKIYSIPGAGSPDSCVVMSGMPATYGAGTKIWLAWNTTLTGGYPTVNVNLHTATDFVGNGASSFQSMLRHQVSNLDPYKTYHARLCANDPASVAVPQWIGDPIKFRMFPDETVTTPTTIKWAFGSCQMFYANDDHPLAADGSPLQKAWEDLRNWDEEDRLGADIVWDVGDLHYQGGNKQNKYGANTAVLTWAKMYWTQITGTDTTNLTGLTTMRKARALVLEDQVSDDHEFSDSNEDSYNSVDRAVQMEASEDIFAMYPLKDLAGKGPRRGMDGDYMITPQVRVMVLDAESLDRSPHGTSDGPTDGKNFLGQPQMDWIYDKLEHEPVTLNIFICSKSWIGDDGADPDGDENYWDKVWNYKRWRAAFGLYVDALNSAEGRTHDTNIMYFGGDRHKVGYIDRLKNPYGHFACYVGSGWAAHHLQPVVGEVGGANGYDPCYEGYKVTGEPWLTMQYLRGLLVDNGDDGVDVYGELRYLKPATPDTNPRYTWDMASLNATRIHDHYDAI